MSNMREVLAAILEAARTGDGLPQALSDARALLAYDGLNEALDEVSWHVNRVEHFVDAGVVTQAEAHTAEAFRALGQVCLELAKIPR